MAQNITIAGATFNAVPSIMVPTAGGGQAIFADPSETTAVAADVAQGKKFLKSDGTYDTGTASGGGGASNIVTGTFKGTTANAAMNITLNYTGNGYPVAVMIYPTEGPYNSETGTIYNLVQWHATVYYTAIKSNMMTAPKYSNGGTKYDAASQNNLFKNSSSQPRNYSNSLAPSIIIYNNVDANVTYIVRLRSAKKMSVFIASTSESYGFAANVEYTYRVIYSE